MKSAESANLAAPPICAARPRRGAPEIRRSASRVRCRRQAHFSASPRPRRQRVAPGDPPDPRTEQLAGSRLAHPARGPLLLLPVPGNGLCPTQCAVGEVGIDADAERVERPCRSSRSRPARWPPRRSWSSTFPAIRPRRTAWSSMLNRSCALYGPPCRSARIALPAPERRAQADDRRHPLRLPSPTRALATRITSPPRRLIRQRSRRNRRRRRGRCARGA